MVADVDGEAGEIVLVIHWMGGMHTELRLPRRRRGQRNSTSKEIVEAVRLLVRICNDDMIAGLLDRNGLRSGPGGLAGSATNHAFQAKFLNQPTKYRLPVRLEEEHRWRRNRC